MVEVEWWVLVLACSAKEDLDKDRARKKTLISRDSVEWKPFDRE